MNNVYRYVRLAVTSSNLVKSSTENPHGYWLCGFLLFRETGQKRQKCRLPPTVAPHRFNKTDMSSLLSIKSNK